MHTSPPTCKLRSKNVLSARVKPVTRAYPLPISHTSPNTGAGKSKDTQSGIHKAVMKVKKRTEDGLADLEAKKRMLERDMAGVRRCLKVMDVVEP